MIEIINTAIEAFEIISYLIGYVPIDIKYYVILVALIWFLKIKSIYSLEIQIKFCILNQHIYYPKFGLD
jgi:hypothetical protein